MKKIGFLLWITLFFSALIAQQLVYIPLNSDREIDRYRQEKKLKINYLCDHFILGTIEDDVKFDFQLIDKEAWNPKFEYRLIGIATATEQEATAHWKGSGNVIFQNAHCVIVKSAAHEMFEYEKSNFRGVVALSDREVVETKPFAFETTKEIRNDNQIEILIASINQDSLQSYVQHLQDYGTRRYNTQQSVQAQNWIQQHFERYGYETELQQVSNYISKNVIAIKTGSKYPDEYVVCGAHYDSYTFAQSNNEPGADDNATGTAGMMEIARVLSEHTFDRSIIICAFTAEEIGLYGSSAYASRCAQEGKNILGYFNIDMSGYLQEGSEMHTCVIHPISASDLYHFYETTCMMYVPELTVQEGSLSGGDSDHTSFNQNGFMGIYPFEDCDNYSPHIHSTNDLIGPSVNNFLQVKTFTKACMANVLRMANLRSTPNHLMATVNENQVSLQWDAMQEEISEYRVYRNNEQIAIVDLNTTTYEDNEVENNVYYTYYITCVFAEDGIESDPSNLVTVYPMSPIIVPFNENWDQLATLPPYWSLEQESGSLQWEVSEDGTPMPHSSPNHLRLYSSTNNVCKLVSPQFDFSQTSDVVLSFWHSQKEWYGDQDRLKIYYKNALANEWILLESYNDNIAAWTQHEIALPNLSGEYFIAFEGITSYGYGVQIDDIEVRGNVTPSETGTLSGNITMMTANGAIAAMGAHVNIYNSNEQLLASEVVQYDGNYSMDVDFPIGVYVLTVGYDNGCLLTNDVTIVVGENEWNYLMECPELTVNPESLFFDVEDENETTKTLTLTNSGYGTALLNAAISYENPEDQWLSISYNDTIIGHESMGLMDVMVDLSTISKNIVKEATITIYEQVSQQTLIVPITLEVYLNVADMVIPFSVYPNPAKKFVTIEGDVSSMTIFNSVGQIMHQINHCSTSTTISTEGFPSGIYLFEIRTTDGNKKTVKVVIR
ncbi:MAG: M20/M25/M40 family metallo-hydrolase [Bacteroidales bacterium]|nr:M20/M25/M40 family metallo-hydrolase [Bacteroidales bacterium]